jgi:hypothetical protein
MNGTAGIIKSMGSILPVKYVRYPTACFCRDDKVPGFFDCFLVGGVSHLAFGTGLRPTTHLGMVVAVAGMMLARKIKMSSFLSHVIIMLSSIVGAKITRQKVPESAVEPTYFAAILTPANSRELCIFRNVCARTVRYRGTMCLVAITHRRVAFPDCDCVSLCCLSCRHGRLSSSRSGRYNAKG